MKASPEDQARLLDLAALDTREQQLSHRAKSLPELAELAELETSTAEVRALLLAQTGEREDTEREFGRIESDVEVVTTRIARDTERLESSSSVKDVAGLELELASLRTRLDNLEDMQLTLMELLEEREKTEQGTRQEFEEFQSRVADASARRDAALAEIEAERATVTDDRGKLVAVLPAELVALYEKQRERYGVGASHLRGGVSSASGVTLHESDLAAIRAAAPDDVVLCPSSNAILVRTSESGL
ncbi:MAG TPA: hypothetical protein PK781_05325 [Terrimesophilobacter sp.]|nr:hypothetical protein [Terrimesophilobacter sp.]